MTRGEEFVRQLIANRDYWLKTLQPTDSPKDVIDGFIHSLLVMIDGDSGLNDFHPILLTDQTENVVINPVEYLHEIFHKLNIEKE